MQNIHDYIAALLVLVGAITLGYLFVQLPGVRKAFLPASVIAGLALLLLGPEVTGKFSEDGIGAELYDLWALLPGLLINVIFGALFLGKPLKGLTKIWKLAAPQAAFGQMIAWGFYAFGGLVALLVLVPFLGANPLSAALLEISFEGGHGTTAGMAPVFEELGYTTGQEMAVAMATTSLFATLIAGFLLIPYGRRKKYIPSRTPFSEVKGMVYHRRVVHQLRKAGISLREELGFFNVLAHISLIVASVAIGWGIHWAILQVELLTWGADGLKIVGYMPAFTFCMFGGMLAQALWVRAGLRVSRPVVELLSGAALAVLVASAIATMELSFFSTDGLTFLILVATGVSWVIFSFLVMARRMFKKDWFTNGIVSVGQSMGTTATGLLFAQMVDPKQRTNVVESFGYKQLLFEPIVGGGIITALSMPLIVLFGLPVFTAICGGVCAAWMIAGMTLARR